MRLNPFLGLSGLCPSTKQGNFIKHRSNANTKKNLNQCMVIATVTGLA